MSLPATPPRADEHAERWREWQFRNAKSSRRAVTRARIAIAVMLTMATVWLAVQLLSSPVWPQRSPTTPTTTTSSRLKASTAKSSEAKKTRSR
jgi:hypothetical protein